MVKINEEKLPELAMIYNECGKSALYRELRNTHGIKYPVTVLSRMKKTVALGYNEATDVFELKVKKNPDEDLFISIDECKFRLNGVSISFIPV